MKSALTGYLASLFLHVAAAGGLVAVSILSTTPAVPPDVGVRPVRNAGPLEVRFQPPKTSAEVTFEKAERRVELTHEVPAETRDLPEAEPAAEEPVPQRARRIHAPRLDAPVVTTARRLPTPPAEAAPATSPFKPGEGAATDLPPSAIHNPHPKYPRVAERRRLEGSVVLAFDVIEDGRCANIQVVESSGHSFFDQEAVRAVREWTFTPATRDGRPVRYAHRYRFTFRLQG